MDSSVHLDNESGHNNVNVGNVGVGSTIFQLQNMETMMSNGLAMAPNRMQRMKIGLQNLGANAVYHPESNSLVLLI